MTKISASKFKEQCLSLLDRLGPDVIVITKHGKPVARLVPIASTHRDLIGALRGKIKFMGNIDSAAVSWDSRP